MTEQEIREMIKNNPIPSASSGKNVVVADSIQLDELVKALHQKFEEELIENNGKWNILVSEREEAHKQALIDARIEELEDIGDVEEDTSCWIYSRIDQLKKEKG